jgi:hypothetical protein
MTLGDDIEKILGEQFTDWQKELLKVGLITDSNYAVPPIADQELKLITVDKIAGYFEVPRELLDETYLVHRDGPQPTRRRLWLDHMRWRWQNWRERTGVRIGSLIAGFDLSHNDDDDY